MLDNRVSHLLTLSQTSTCFYVSAVQVFWKHCWKRRNSSQWTISPFRTWFFTFLVNFVPSNLKLSSANSFSICIGLPAQTTQVNLGWCLRCHTLYHTIPTIYDLGKKKPFENTVGRENAGNQHFLLFPQCFVFPFPTQISIFQFDSFCHL